jgi:hypothetical protein
VAPRRRRHGGTRAPTGGGPPRPPRLRRNNGRTSRPGRVVRRPHVRGGSRSRRRAVRTGQIHRAGTAARRHGGHRHDGRAARGRRRVPRPGVLLGSGRRRRCRAHPGRGGGGGDRRGVVVRGARHTGDPCRSVGSPSGGAGVARRSAADHGERSRPAPGWARRGLRPAGGRPR